MEMTAFRPKFLCASLLRLDFRDRPFREKQFVKSVLKSLFRRANNHFSRAREAQRVEREGLAEFGAGWTGIAFRETRKGALGDTR